MKIHELAQKTRSVRRFRNDIRIPEEQILALIDTARYAPNAANLQLLRFSIVTSDEKRKKIFPAIKWAGYLEDWDGPEEGERPAAYIVIHNPAEETRYMLVDAGIAAAYIVLAAREAGYGSCMIMSFDAGIITKAVGSPEDYNPLIVIALGVPDEEIVLEESEGSIRYWRDEQGRHHVPKLCLDEILTEHTHESED